MNTDTLEAWEKWPIAALFGAQGLQIAEWYISARMPAEVTGILPWVVTAGGIAAMVAIDGAMIAAVMGARAGRRGTWTWLAIGVTALFGALVALDLNGAIIGIGPWLHAGFAVTIAAYLMHLIQPRLSTVRAEPVNGHHGGVNVTVNALVAPAHEVAQLVDTPQPMLDRRPEIVKWRDDDGLTFEAIGQRLAISRQAAQARYASARKGTT